MLRLADQWKCNKLESKPLIRINCFNLDQKGIQQNNIS